MVVLCFLMYIFLKYFPVIGYFGYFHYTFSSVSSTNTVTFLYIQHFFLILLKIIKENHTQTTYLFLKRCVRLYCV